MKSRNGLASLLRPEDSVLVLIDHQPYQLTNVNSHDPQMVVNNATALAKAAKVSERFAQMFVNELLALGLVDLERAPEVLAGALPVVGREG